VISEFCKNTAPIAFQEAGCIVCGRLTLLTELQKLSDLNLNLGILYQSGITQKERYSITDALEDISGPILEDNLDSICNTCYKSLSEGNLPSLALGNGKWIGKVPKERVLYWPPQSLPRLCQTLSRLCQTLPDSSKSLARVWHSLA